MTDRPRLLLWLLAFFLVALFAANVRPDPAGGAELQGTPGPALTPEFTPADLVLSVCEQAAADLAEVIAPATVFCADEQYRSLVWHGADPDFVLRVAGWYDYNRGPNVLVLMPVDSVAAAHYVILHEYGHWYDYNHVPRPEGCTLDRFPSECYGYNVEDYAEAIAAMYGGTAAPPPSPGLSDLLPSCRPDINRLYLTLFARQADTAGCTYWSQSGRTLDEIATFFVASEELKLRYGALDDPSFVGLVYLNVLGRNADADGATYWTDLLLARKITRAELLVQFSESEENKSR